MDGPISILEVLIRLPFQPFAFLPNGRAVNRPRHLRPAMDWTRCKIEVAHVREEKIR
jgi:hypothetical protein